MSDNLKTWPEHISTFCIGKAADKYGYEQHIDEPISYSDAEENTTIRFDESAEVNPTITQAKYIRVDIAKERENKLIKEALMYGYSMADYPVRPKDKDISFVFLHAGLEELK